MTAFLSAASAANEKETRLGAWNWDKHLRTILQPRIVTRISQLIFWEGFEGPVKRRFAGEPLWGRCDLQVRAQPTKRPLEPLARGLVADAQQRRRLALIGVQDQHRQQEICVGADHGHQARAQGGELAGERWPGG